MNSDLMEALSALEKEKKISKDTLIEAIENSLLTACKNHYGKADNFIVKVDPDTGDFSVVAAKEVVENVEDDVTQISLAKAKEINSKYDIGDTVLNESEMVKGEHYKPNDRIKVYVVEVKDDKKGPRILVSRTHPELVKRLFEEEVTEVRDGTVEIKNVAREAGSRTKMSVWSKDPNVDAVGACVGVNGARVNAVVDELGGEKIDIINWSENPANLIENALSPAKVVSVVADDEEKTAQVIVPDYQLSLAIGREGQNARLAAKLTGFKIDIKSETQAKELGLLDMYYPEAEYDEEYSDEYPDEQ